MLERLAAVAVLLAGGAYLALSLPLPRGTAARPGAGFFPLLVGIFACLVTLSLAARAFRRPRSAAAAAAAAPGGHSRVAATAGLLAGYCLALPWAGYTPVTFLFVALLLRRLGTGWPAALATGLVSAGASYYAFAVLLGVPLPRGAWLE